MAKERVHKIIARLGLASRRRAEEWIMEGLVSINGKIAKVGDQADLQEDAIKVRGKLLKQTDEKSRVYFAYHKPKGYISTMGEDPQGRPSISEHLKHLKARVFAVGRLEFNQEGLLLLTDDGDFADQLRRSTDVVRVFRIKLDREPTPQDVTRLEKGGRVEGRLIQPYSVKLTERFTKKSMVELAIQGMGAIDIKTFMSHKGFRVDRVILAAIGQVTLGELKPGELRPLKKTQIDAILEKPELGLKRVDGKEGLFIHEPRVKDEEKEVREEFPRGREREPTRMPDHKPRPNFRKEFGAESEKTQSFVISSEGKERAPRFDRGARPARDGARPPRKSFESKRSTAGGPKVKLTFAGGGDSRDSRGPSRSFGRDSRGPSRDSRGPSRGDSRGPRSDTRGDSGARGGFRGSPKRSRR